ATRFGPRTVRRKGILSAAEIGRFIDTGPEFVNRITALRLHRDQGSLSQALDPFNDIPFWSVREGIDPTTPTYAMLHAHPSAVIDGMRIKGIAEAQARVKAAREAAEPIVAAYAGDIAKVLPD